MVFGHEVSNLLQFFAQIYNNKYIKKKKLNEIYFFYNNFCFHMVVSISRLVTDRETKRQTVKRSQQNNLFDTITFCYCIMIIKYHTFNVRLRNKQFFL